MAEVTLSAAIMAHPTRAAMVEELTDQLDRPVPVVWDKVNDRHDTGVRALEAYDPTCTHHLVLQDDVVPSRDLLAGAERALAHVPDGHPVSLYIGRVKPFRAAVQNAVLKAGHTASWVTMAGVYWGPAIIVPTAVLPELTVWFRESKVKNYDRRVSTWFKGQGVRCWYSWPSLVDHRGDASLVRKQSGVRRAHRFLGEGESALDVDWSLAVVDMDGTERLDRQRQRRVPA